MRTAFGFDIAGYAGGNSGFARADAQNGRDIKVTVYEGHVFGQRLTGSDPLGEVAEAEKQVLKACCEVGTVLVDTPVDLQGLPYPENAYFTWELVKRPVDYAFDALAPLADRIGAPVARFQNMFREIRGESEALSDRVFETYPAASLKCLGLWSSGYGNHSIQFAEGRWMEGALAAIANRLDMVADEGVALTGDEFDAALCAVTGVVEEDKLLCGDELSEKVRRKIEERVAVHNHSWIPTVSPDNYVLMKARPEKEVRIVKQSVESLEEMLEEVTT